MLLPGLPVMHTYPTHMNSAALIKELKADGWVLVHTAGSHHQFKHPNKTGKGHSAPPEERPSCRHREEQQETGGPLRAYSEQGMLYPIYVHKDDGSAYGATFPDFPGCFAAADDLQSLPGAAQEAAEAHFGGDDDPIPAPSSPERWASEQEFTGGFWMLVEVDLAKVRAKAIRLNISLNEGLVQRIDAAAKARGQSQSAFLATAAEREMAGA